MLWFRLCVSEFRVESDVLCSFLCLFPACQTGSNAAPVPWRSVTFRDSGAVSQIRLLTPSFCPYTRFRFHKLYRNPDSLTSVSSPCLSASRIPISVPGSVKVLSSVRVHGFSVQRWNPVLFLDFSPKTQTGLRSMGDPSVFAYSPGLWSWRAAETRHAHTLAFTFLNLKTYFFRLI